MKKLTPLRAIRAFCIECAGTWKEVELCMANPEDIKKAREAGDAREYDGCPLYPYRLGHNPFKKTARGKGNLEALAKWRKKANKPSPLTNGVGSQNKSI